MVGGCLQFFGAFFHYELIAALGLIPSLAGICALLMGWQGLRWAWPAIAFLLFMIPPPYFIQTALGMKLQKVATLGSTFILQTLGFPAFSEGNLILLPEGRLGVEEVCSGLSMLITFFAVSTAFAIVIRRPWLDRVVIVLAAIPIALITNIMRITVTGILQEMVNQQVASAVFHDWAGWYMVPFALLLLWGVLGILSRLLLPKERKPLPSVAFSASGSSFSTRGHPGP
jgi:exosortase